MNKLFASYAQTLHTQYLPLNLRTFSISCQSKEILKKYQKFIISFHALLTKPAPTPIRAAGKAKIQKLHIFSKFSFGIFSKSFNFSAGNVFHIAERERGNIKYGSNAIRPIV